MYKVWVLFGFMQYDGCDRPVIAVFDHNPEQGECELALNEYLKDNVKPDGIDVQEFDVRTAPVAPAPVIDREARAKEYMQFVSDTCRHLMKAGKTGAAVTFLRFAYRSHPEIDKTREWGVLLSGPLGDAVIDSHEDMRTSQLDFEAARVEARTILRELYPEAAAELDRYNPEVH